jgi:hypothetical protein
VRELGDQWLIQHGGLGSLKAHWYILEPFLRCRSDIRFNRFMTHRR